MAKKSVSLDVVVYDANNPLTVAEAKKLLGWKVVDDEPYHLVDKTDGKKFVRFANSTANRPFRSILSKQYASDILRNKWELNGETIIIDAKNQIVSGQHRLAGLVFAEWDRLTKPQYYQENYGWKGPCSIQAIVVKGVKPDSADSVDKGQKRSHGDVLFRRHEFKGTYGDREKQMLANDLAVAARLLWLRLGGKDVSDAPKFLHSEMLDLIEAHPGLKTFTQFVFDEDGGDTRKESKIKQYVSRGYLAAMAYLMATRHTDPVKYLETGEIDISAQSEAEEFIVMLANGGDKTGSPTYELRSEYARQTAKGGGRDRDTDVLGPMVKAMNAYITGATLTGKTIKLKPGEIDKQRPMLGGIDGTLSQYFLEEEEETQEPVKEEPPKKGRGKGKGAKAAAPSFKVKKKEEGWFVTDTGSDDDEYGPYETKAEAADCAVGLKSFWEENNAA
jgi:hypothetical protein